MHGLSRNVVATAFLDVKLDLKNIAQHARNAEYNPKARVTHYGYFVQMS